MNKGRTLVFSGVLGAAIGLIVAPRLGESRRDALDRLRLAARPGRGSLRAFAGTPCATADPVVVEASARPACDPLTGTGGERHG